MGKRGHDFKTLLKLHREYLDGSTLADLELRHGVARQPLLREWGKRSWRIFSLAEVSSRRRDQSHHGEIYEDYRLFLTGASLKELASERGISVPNLLDRFREHDFPLKGRAVKTTDVLTRPQRKTIEKWEEHYGEGTVDWTLAENRRALVLVRDKLGKEGVYLLDYQGRVLEGVPPSKSDWFDPALRHPNLKTGHRWQSRVDRARRLKRRTLFEREFILDLAEDPLPGTDTGVVVHDRPLMPKRLNHCGRPVPSPVDTTWRVTQSMDPATRLDELEFRQAWDKLFPFERLLIGLREGWYRRSFTLQEIGDCLMITRERVRQLEQDARWHLDAEMTGGIGDDEIRVRQKLLTFDQADRFRDLILSG